MGKPFDEPTCEFIGDRYVQDRAIQDEFGDMFRTSRDRYEKNRWGRVEDPYLLDNITMTIREGIIGANGFRADYAVIVTWERMAYGGAPKITQVLAEDLSASQPQYYTLFRSIDTKKRSAGRTPTKWCWRPTKSAPT